MYLNMLNSGVGVSLFVKFNPVFVDVKTSKTGGLDFFVSHPGRLNK